MPTKKNAKVGSKSKKLGAVKPLIQIRALKRK
jgi:hypothetical protein